MTKIEKQTWHQIETRILLEEFSNSFLVLWADTSQNLLAVEAGGCHQALGRISDPGRGLSLEGRCVEGLDDEAEHAVSLAEDSRILSEKESINSQITGSKSIAELTGQSIGR